MRPDLKYEEQFTDSKENGMTHQLPTPAAIDRLAAIRADIEDLRGELNRNVRFASFDPAGAGGSISTLGQAYNALREAAKHLSTALDGVEVVEVKQTIVRRRAR